MNQFIKMTASLISGLIFLLGCSSSQKKPEGREPAQIVEIIKAIAASRAAPKKSEGPYNFYAERQAWSKDHKNWYLCEIDVNKKEVQYNEETEYARHVSGRYKTVKITDTVVLKQINQLAQLGDGFDKSLSGEEHEQDLKLEFKGYVNYSVMSGLGRTSTSKEVFLIHSVDDTQPFYNGVKDCGALRYIHLMDQICSSVTKQAVWGEGRKEYIPGQLFLLCRIPDNR